MTHSRRFTIAAALSLLFLLLVILYRQYFSEAVESEPVRVEDRAGLFSSIQRDRMADYHAALRDTHDIDYRVLTLSESGDIAWKAHRHFDDTGVGSLSRNGRGLLLVIDPKQDEVRLEVSTSLEGVYTDAFVAYLQHRQMVPFFQSGRVSDGILATTELIVTRAQEAVAGKAFSPPTEARSMGGGATTEAGIDNGETMDDFKQQKVSVDAAGLSPKQVVDTYLEAMDRRDARHSLPIYSSASVRMLKGWTVTPAQMDNIAKSYAKCHVDRVFTEEGLAVVRYPAEERQCAPHFLKREEGEWKLDLTVMSTIIRFNHKNQWRFVNPYQHPYRFAFTDWRFDGKGFPRVD